jgi:PmbA protein
MIKPPPAGSLLSQAESVVGIGKKYGADEVEVVVSDGREFSVDVRQGEIENLIEAGSRFLSFRLIKDKKTAHATTSDLQGETIERLVKNAVVRAELGNSDEFAGLPVPSTEKIDVAWLRLFDPEVAELQADAKIALAGETERVALADKRITNSYGASFITNEVSAALASSNGFAGSYDQTFCSLSCRSSGRGDRRKVEDYWFPWTVFSRTWNRRRQWQEACRANGAPASPPEDKHPNGAGHL